MERKVIKELKGGSDTSVVNLVEIDGKKLVHKRAPKKTIIGEKFFHHTLSRRGIPSLIMFSEHEDGDNDVVFEYIEGSPSLNAAKSLENVRKYGELMSAMHTITYPDFFNIDDDGNPTTTSWSTQLKVYTQHNFDEFVEENNKDKKFSDNEVVKIESLINPLAYHTHDTFSLVHGDMHSGNVMIKDGVLIPYDSFGEFMVAPVFYDLAVILSEEFRSSMFVFKEGDDHAESKAQLDAFIEGYGRDFVEKEIDLIKRYALLRAMGRYPNPWIKNQVEMMKNILKSYS